MTVLIGRNYSKADPRREGGYTLFYLAINLGAFIAPFICADFVGHRFGYRWGFVAAAAGNVPAAIVFQLRYPRLLPLLPQVPRARASTVLWVLAAIALVLYPTALLLSRPQILSTSMYVLMALLVLYFVVSCARRRDIGCRRSATSRYCCCSWHWCCSGP